VTQAALHADETPVAMLAEYNRVFKCLHLLDYADDQQLRQVIQESLNRGEQLQVSKRALAALANDQFRGTSPDEMTQWNACADLLVNYIVYYNAMIMSSFKTYCIETGDGKQLKHLRTISPASWEHILLTGFMIWPTTSRTGILIRQSSDRIWPPNRLQIDRKRAETHTG
jgi:hypothetical protein